MELILIRHGLPLRVEAEDGSPADPPLSDIGHQQARLVADWLEDTEIDFLYSSPMQRAHQTAVPLAESKGLEVELREGVAEYDRHADHYIPVEELKKFDYDRWLRLMRGEIDNIDFPKFCEGVVATLDEIIATHPGKTVAVTCHGGVINVWTCHLLGMEPRLFFNADYTSISRYRAASSGVKSIVTLNEHSHLKLLPKEA
ncbi:MAG: histidine phosphatase family protein [Gammaproteobacteria bacterium]|jgi:2,3-bisphosphoglycerate-dependent phosphoglycerate mutase|nr:histidine phosphatase family protein [Gammaproteobacteria bacterium]MBT4493248.1 histidine phosphatase family protein [Gammaproteobacteria bacterium]MBT7369523.1 histidine phosphatase family protein [Gammaproteobacteria bacterium]